MKSRDLLFFGGVLLVVGFLYWLSISGRGVPPIPADAVHEAVTVQADCIQCHGENGPNKRKVTHPPKDQCFECHDRAKPGEPAKEEGK